MKLFADYRYGGKVRYVVARTDEELMRVPPDIQTCTVFVGYKDASGREIWGGTAFLLGLSFNDERLGHMVYGITAKHNLIDLKGSPRNQTILIRANLKSGGAESLPTNFSDWYLHPTEDIAVLDWPEDERPAVVYVPEAMCQDAEGLKARRIDEGDEVFIAGLFRRHYGRSRNVPVIRIGNIAMMPDEPIPSRIGEIEGAYLVEIRSIGGLSGSPTFVHYQIPQFRPPRFQWHLIGMIHGHWDVPKEAFTDFDDSNEQINMGMAIIIPINKVLEFLKTHPELKKRREDIIAEEKEKALPAMDGRSPESVSD